MRNKSALPIIVAGALLCLSSTAAAEEKYPPAPSNTTPFLMHWGGTISGNFTWFMAGVPSGAVPIFGQLLIGPTLEIGSKLSFDLGFGLAVGGVTQNPATVAQPVTLTYFTPWFFYFSGGVMYGAITPGNMRVGVQAITEFSLSTSTIFSESRLLVGPSFEFTLLAGFRAQITAGYASDWYALNGQQQGLATLVTLKFIP